MPSYDPSNADCFVFTFKEGLLSPVAHDLRLKLERFSIDVGEGSIVARFDTSSLRVDTPMKDGKANPSALGDRDRAKIAEQIRTEVLHSAKHPEARFQSSAVEKRADGGYDIAGDLTLHGVTRPLRARTEAVGGGQRLEVTLHQPDFGITPFRAMMGTLKIQADLQVRITTR
jgi:polyisoprenoid-binding protein YceI